MGQVSPHFRRSASRLFHWCEPCEQLHPLPWPGHGWSFNEDYTRPTFTPSFAQDRGTGRDCHYIITDGVINYCSDCHHDHAGKSVPLWPLPEDYRDFADPVLIEVH